MFENPIAPKPDPASKKVREPFAKQPSYDQKKGMYPGGQYYGTGFKAKIGSLRGEGSQHGNIPQKAMRKAPESLA